MEQQSLIRDTMVVGVMYLVILVVFGLLIASIQGQSLSSFFLELFTDPFWLFVVAIGLYFGVTGYRKAKEMQSK